MSPRRAKSPLITLLTDFGLDDAYVGSMKGVIAALAPRAAVIDITHGVEPQDILGGGLRWAAAVPYFPAGAVHVAVVDPGVGGEREIIAVRARGSIFLAPDNGLLGFVADPREAEEAVSVEERRYFLPAVSRTFHGRDIFAPVAARLALGLPLARLGPARRTFRSLPLPAVRRRRSRGGIRLEGQIIDVDKFGNCITNIRVEREHDLSDIRVRGHRLSAPVTCYGERSPGKPLAIAGSSGYLEIAVNLGRADRALKLRRGHRVSARIRSVQMRSCDGGGADSLTRR